MKKEFTISYNAVVNLLHDYASHKLMCEEYEGDERYEEYDLYDDAEYSHHAACCATAENWLRAIGISPESNCVQEIIEKERK